MKKKPSGVLIEYARKRDSCSFLISKSILEEYLSEFYIYSSNKFGHNKESAVKLIIENEEILLKNANKNIIDGDNKFMTITIAAVCGTILVLSICCCLCIKCSKQQNRKKNENSYDDEYKQKPDLYEGILRANLKIKIFFYQLPSFTDNVNLNENQLLENEKLYSSLKFKEKQPVNKSLTSTFLIKGTGK